MLRRVVCLVRAMAGLGLMNWYQKVEINGKTVI
jgi:hypothetical protein